MTTHGKVLQNVIFKPCGHARAFYFYFSTNIKFYFYFSTSNFARLLQTCHHNSLYDRLFLLCLCVSDRVQPEVYLTHPCFSLSQCMRMSNSVWVSNWVVFHGLRFVISSSSHSFIIPYFTAVSLTLHGILKWKCLY